MPDSERALKRLTVTGLVLAGVISCAALTITYMSNQPVEGVASPGGEFIAIHRISVSESILHPYGDWVELRKSKYASAPPNTANAVFFGSCVPRDSLKLHWSDTNTLNIACNQGTCPIAKQKENWADIRITYQISFSDEPCAS